MIAKRISCILSTIICMSFTSVTSAEIYRCQAEQGGEAVFTDNKYACHLSAAKSMTVKPTALRVERKVMKAIPDLSQRDPKAGFPDGGRKYCAPVAVSNSLSSALGGMPDTQQIELAHTLGSSGFMATGEKGTSPSQLLKGVDQFLATQLSKQQLPFYNAEQLEYHGQRTVPRKYNPSFDKTAELPWLINGIKNEKHIWLNIGWYKNLPNGKQKRVGGHWVTLVGYEKLGSLKDGQGEFLIVNDPATMGGKKQEYLKVKVAKLNGRTGYKLLNQASKPRKADIAWIEGAIQLAL